jgi:4-deoxy-L-threo-5-hexosulose-uronate ketol-isomerase
MEQRYATNPAQIPGMTTDELRAQYLVPDLFVAGEVNVTYTHHDRIVLGGAMPAGTDLVLTGYPEIRSEYFLEHRELGIINVGGTGTVTADGEVYTLVTGACLYLGRGIRDVVFADAAESDGAQFYLFSAPAHTAYPAALVSPGEGTVRQLGDQVTSNRRTLNQYIHENGIRSSWGSRSSTPGRCGTPCRPTPMTVEPNATCTSTFPRTRVWSTCLVSATKPVTSS